jgi:hypothetical protein
MESLVVLVHSPLVGPFTWSSVAERLRATAGCDVLVPTLADSGETPPPYWRQYAASVGAALASVPPERPLVFVGHSGAGPLLPIIAQTSGHPMTAYLFVDAGLPHPGQSHLDEMQASVPEFAAELRALLAAGGRFPNWTDDDLCEEIPDGAVRRRLLAELHPRGLDYFAEAMPDVPGWPDALAGYVVFTEGYHDALERAQQAGWPTRAFAAGHFHLLVDPAAVAQSLADLMEQMAAQPRR